MENKDYIFIPDIIRKWDDLPRDMFNDIFLLLEKNKEYYFAAKEKTFRERLADVCNSYIAENFIGNFILKQLGSFEFTDKKRNYLYLEQPGKLADLVGQFGHRSYTFEHPHDYVEVKNVKFAANETVLRWYFNNGLKSRKLALHGCDILIAYVEQEDTCYYIEVDNSTGTPVLGDIVMLCASCGLKNKIVRP